MKKIILASVVATTLILSGNVNAAPVSVNYSVQDIIYTYVATNAVDTYGIGINTFNLNSNVSVNYTYDNDPSNATSIGSSPDHTDYEFNSPNYNASLIIDGINVFNSNRSLITLTNDTTQALGAIPQYLTDIGFPSTLPGPTDGLWMAGYSAGHTFNPQHSGLEFSIDFFDFSGNLLTANDVIPTTAPDLNNVDIAILNILQYENGVLQFEAAGIVVNNISIVPIPAAAWLFGSGLIVLIGFSRREKIKAN